VRFPILLIIALLCFSKSEAQTKMESDIDFAFQNAKKGIYWALSNIPAKKMKLENDLIADDKLYASVTLYQEVNGIKIIAHGYYQTNQVELVIYRSNDTLLKDGYLKSESKPGSD
jgi:hypothetical protein